MNSLLVSNTSVFSNCVRMRNGAGQARESPGGPGLTSFFGEGQEEWLSFHPVWLCADGLSGFLPSDHILKGNPSGARISLTHAIERGV